MIRKLLSFLPPCLLYTFTGIYCPACGGTRAFLSLLNGNIMKSLYYHPLVIYTAVYFLWAAVRISILKISGGKMQVYIPPVKIMLLLGGGILVFNFLVHNLLYMFWGIRM